MSSGYVYLLPLHGEDWLKVGISTDPLRRAREFSRRFHDLFDFDQALLLETGSPRDAAAVERQLREDFREHRAPMPLVVRTEAGGHTEWYRGAYPAISARVRALEAAGYTLHAPARSWYGAALQARRGELHDWASTLLRQHLHDPDAPLAEPLPADAAALLADTVAAYRHFGVGVGEHLPEALRPWYRALPPLAGDKDFIDR
jgi:hypothetical protein